MSAATESDTFQAEKKDGFCKKEKMEKRLRDENGQNSIIDHQCSWSDPETVLIVHILTL